MHCYGGGSGRFFLFCFFVFFGGGNGDYEPNFICLFEVEFGPAHTKSVSDQKTDIFLSPGAQIFSFLSRKSYVTLLIRGKRNS